MPDKTTANFELCATRIEELRARADRAARKGNVELHVDMIDVQLLLSFAEAAVEGYRRAQARKLERLPTPLGEESCA